MAKRPRRRPPSQRRPRKRLISVFLLNVKAQPHEDGASTYRSVWHAAVENKLTVSFHGDKHARIATANDRPDGIIVGEIWTYTKVGGRGGVMNIRKGQMLEPDEFKAIPFDWEGHGFNPRTFPYAFSPQDHRVGVPWGGGLTPMFLRYVLSTMFNTSTVLSAGRVKDVIVDIEQKETALEEILGLNLDRLTIHLTRPNPDDLAGLEEEFRAELEEQKAQSQDIELKAAQGEHLQPNDRTKTTAKVALSNGHVEGKGRDPETNRATTLTTLSSPLKAADWFLPKVETMFDHLARRTRELSAMVKARLKK